MARFPYYEDNVKALGRLLAEAATDPAARRRLERNPKAELLRIGLPPETLAAFDFKVIAETADRPVAIMPFLLNQDRLARHDPDYLAQVADTVVSASVN